MSRSSAARVHSAEMGRMSAALRTERENLERVAKLAERERIARDLHDVLGHTLSVIVLKSELAAKLADSDITRAASEIREVESIGRESLGELREALAGYRAAGIAADIERARAALTAGGVRFECEVENVRLAPRTEAVVACGNLTTFAARYFASRAGMRQWPAISSRTRLRRNLRMAFVAFRPAIARSIRSWRWTHGRRRIC